MHRLCTSRGLATVYVGSHVHNRCRLKSLLDIVDGICVWLWCLAPLEIPTAFFVVDRTTVCEEEGVQMRYWTTSVPPLLRSIPTAAAMACVRCVSFVLFDVWRCTLHLHRVVVRPWVSPLGARVTPRLYNLTPKGTTESDVVGSASQTCRSETRFPSRNQARWRARVGRNHRQAWRKTCV